jgi:tetratricopeptide (TPR) repeat protein
MVRKFLIASLLLLLIISNVAVGGNGGYRSPFAIGFGARQLAMGGAGVASVNSSSSLFWNPAGLARVDRNDLQLFHMNLFMDTRYDVVSFAYPTISLGAFGLGIGDLSSGEFDRMEDFINQGTFSSRQDLFLVGYGFPVLDNLSTGVTVKGVYYDIAGYRDSGFGFDLGLIYSLSFIEGMSVGLRAADITGPRIKLNTLDQRYPWLLRGGLAYEKIVGEKHSLALNLDIENTEKLGTDFYAGGEFGLSGILFARIGYMGDKFTAGAGLNYSGLSFDYAFASMPDLASSHRLSLSYSFGASVQEKREARDQKLVEEQLNQYKNEQEQERNNRVEQELARAAQFESENKPYQAIESYYKVLALDAQNDEALDKVTLLLDQIRQDIALEASKGYTEQLVTSQIELGDTYYSNKDYEKAAQQYNLALLLNPDNKHAKERLDEIGQQRQTEIEALRSQVQTDMNRDDYDSALRNLGKILAIDPENREAVAVRGRILNIIKSSDYLNEALKYFDQAEYQKSIALTDSALALNPDSEGAQSLKRRLRSYTAKVTTLEDIKKNEQHWQIYLEGMDKYQASEFKEAIRLWQSLLEYYPNNPNLKRNIEQAAERAAKE